ncbi:MutS domain III [Cooperia oncophora]
MYADLLLFQRNMSCHDKWNSNFYDQRSTYGICFVDTSVGKFFVGEFRDDDYNSFLRTIIANFTPVQLSNDQYLGHDFSTWPDTLRKMLDPDSVIAKPNTNYHLALSALGAVLHYLQRCLIDVDMVTMHDFSLLEPLEQSPVERLSQGSVWANRQMILDGVTLENLNLVPGDNRDSQAASLSLYSTVNKCQTAFGKRLLRQWICSPTCDMTVLKDRQDAIEYLMDSSNVRVIEKIGELLRSLPDLERLLQSEFEHLCVASVVLLQYAMTDPSLLKRKLATDLIVLVAAATLMVRGLCANRYWCV